MASREDTFGIQSSLRRRGSAGRREAFANDKESAGSGGVVGAPQRKRSILKYESLENEDATTSMTESVGESRLRGVLKKDSSYDEGLKPILKNVDTSEDFPTVTTGGVTTISPPPPPSSTSTSSTSSPSSSSEDLAKVCGGRSRRRAFSDVIIDPIPASLLNRGEDANEGSRDCEEQQKAGTSPREIFSPSQSRYPSRKASLKDRQPVIPPESVKISSDDRDLVEKLQRLTQEAEAIKLRQMEVERERQLLEEQQQRIRQQKEQEELLHQHQEEPERQQCQQHLQQEQGQHLPEPASSQVFCNKDSVNKRPELG